MPNQILSLDQMLEEVLTSLYSRWFTLPRRSTLPALTELRLKLAAQLEALGPPVEVTVYEQAMIGFAQSASQLPEVIDSAGATLRVLAQTEPASVRPAWGGPLIGITNVAPERIAHLVGMLRAAEPTQYSIMHMQYAAEETPQAWSAVWDKVAPVLDRVPAGVRDEVLAIRGQLDAAVSATSNWAEQRVAYAAALAGMEEIPTVIRIAWPIFLQCKYKGVVSSMRGAVVQPPPPWPVFETMAAASPTSRGETLDVDFFANIQAPSQASLGKTIWLLVQLTIKAVDGSATTDKVPVQFTRPSPDAPPPPEIVEVRLVAPGFKEETTVWSRTIMVYPDRDSQPAVFLLTAQSTGLQHLTIDFYHKGRMISSFGADTTVVDGPVTESSRLRVEQIDMAPFAGDPPAPADLELRVVKAADQNSLGFMLNSLLPAVPFRNQAVGQKTLTEKDPQTFFANRLARLSQLAADGDAEAGVDRVTHEIAAMGEELFELLMPTELQKVYWEIIKPLREQGVIKTLLITSDEPWIPWELVKPYQWDDVSDSEKSDGFLVETFTLSRWLAGRGPAAALAVEQVTLIMPDLDLTFVQEEQKFFATLAAQRHLQVTGPLQRRLEVTDLFRSGGYQVLHFATHGAFNSANADQSQLSLKDGDLSPGDLAGSNLSGIRKAKPLVFLNACHSGRVALSLTGLGGWADKLFREAKVSAFVGTLWEVNDQLAAEFAKFFYSRLADGVPLGEAIKAARTHIQQLEPANPTWLAYALYGDPNAKVTIGHEN